MSDYIDRQAAIDAVNGMPDCPNGYSDTYDKARIIAVLEDVPSVQPQRMRGKWIRSEDQMAEDIINGNYMFICSNCSHVDLHAKTVEVPYCWYCGADMRGKK